jgi:molybdate transport system substrate-binding protein
MMPRLLLLLLLFVSVGCEESSPTLTVFAASSLTDAFEALAAEYEAERGVDVRFNFAGSQALRTQIEHGAPADVFASANPEHATALHCAGLVLAPREFARNELAIAIPAHTTDVGSLEELPNATRLVVGAPDVPIGRYTETLFGRAARHYGGDFQARIERSIVSRESNVRLVLARVALGEADAAVVYRTDAVAAGDEVSFLELPDELSVSGTYLIAPTRATQQRAFAESWIEFTGSSIGSEILRDHGFVVDGEER